MIVDDRLSAKKAFASNAVSQSLQIDTPPVVIVGKYEAQCLIFKPKTSFLIYNNSKYKYPHSSVLFFRVSKICAEERETQKAKEGWLSDFSF